MVIFAIMMLNKKTKVKDHSLDWDTDFFDIVAGVLQVDILAPWRHEADDTQQKLSLSQTMQMT